MNNTQDVTCEVRYILSKAFLCGLPTSRSPWNQIKLALVNLSEYLSGDELARVVIESTLQHPITNQYPRNSRYVNNVFVWLRGIWHEHRWTGEECLQGSLDEFSSRSVEGNLEIGYKSYSTGEDESYITLLESFEGISRGTTGLSSWGAAQVLASWCLENPESIAGKNVVELGSGIGYTAVSILSSGVRKEKPASYTATDYHPHVLSILHHNLSLLHSTDEKNFRQLSKYCAQMNAKLSEEELPAGEFGFWEEIPGFKYRETWINVRQLDWRNPNRDLPSCDVILAADVVYATHLFPDLVKVIRQLLSIRGQTSGGAGSLENSLTHRDALFLDVHDNCETAANNSHPHIQNKLVLDTLERKSESGLAKAYLACTRRNLDTLNEFLFELTTQGLAYKTVFQTTLDRGGFNGLAFDESYKPIKIIEIQNNSKISEAESTE